jgi:hypothetical protein
MWSIFAEKWSVLNPVNQVMTSNIDRAGERLMKHVNKRADYLNYLN